MKRVKAVGYAAKESVLMSVGPCKKISRLVVLSSKSPAGMSNSEVIQRLIKYNRYKNKRKIYKINRN